MRFKGVRVAQESIKGWGGVREGSGRSTKIPTGSGERHKIFVGMGDELLDLLRIQFPGMNDQDTVRAACWAAVGRPNGQPS